MVLPAASALSLTTTEISRNDSAELSLEVSAAETKILRATGFGVYAITYNADIIGNPAIDPRIFTADLPPLQQQFYNAFIAAGYIVGLDTLTGYWSINWSPTGPEVDVLVYTFRTSIDPTAMVARTISAVQIFFSGLVPIVHTDVAYNGFIDEAGFGGTTSTYYEFTVVAGQNSDRTNHASDLEGFLRTQGLGYTGLNSAVYLLTP